MITFAFWNINKNVTPEAIALFAHEWQADILILAENHIPNADIIRELNTNAKRLYFPDPGNSSRLTILIRFLPDVRTLVRDSPDVAIRHYKMPLGESLLMVAAHLSSKLWKKTEDQILASTRMARYIREAEERVGHSRTVVIGDLNMNPFEAGIVGSEGLHAIMDRNIAKNGSRTVKGEKYDFFYNPMWSTFGDFDLKPSGTYFYDSGSEVNFYWNIFDQILLRPTLLAFMPTEPVTVVTELRGESLLDPNGRPDRKRMSDHLPIVCRLHEIMEE